MALSVPMSGRPFVTAPPVPLAVMLKSPAAAPVMLTLSVPLARTVTGTVGKFGDTPSSMVPAFALATSMAYAAMHTANAVLNFDLKDMYRSCRSLSGRMSVGV